MKISHHDGKSVSPHGAVLNFEDIGIPKANKLEKLESVLNKIRSEVQIHYLKISEHLYARKTETPIYHFVSLSFFSSSCKH